MLIDKISGLTLCINLAGQRTNMLGLSYTLKERKYFLNHIPKETTNHEYQLHVEYYDMKKVKEIKE